MFVLGPQRPIEGLLRAHRAWSPGMVGPSLGPSLGTSPNLGRQLGAVMDYHQFVSLSPEDKNAEILKLLPLLSPFAKVRK